MTNDETQFLQFSEFALQTKGVMKEEGEGRNPTDCSCPPPIQ